MSAMRRRLVACLVPKFLKPHNSSLVRQGFLDYRSLWLLAIALLAVVSLLPLCTLTAIDYALTGQVARSEQVLRTVRTASNARRTVTYFLDERRSVLEFTLREETFDLMKDPEHLAQVLRNMRAGFNGIVDLGLLTEDGVQVSYAGPFDLQDRSYKDMPWFKTAMEKGAYISDVFLGFRNIPHAIVAVRGETRTGRPYLLRATLDTLAFSNMLASLEAGNSGDAFIINGGGILQTPSKTYGAISQVAGIPVPAFSERTDHFVTTDSRGVELLVAYAYIKASPFILCVVKPTSEAMVGWLQPRMDLLWLAGISLVVIVTAIYVISTYMTNAIYDSNLRQAQVMERMEQTGRLASIGRLAAGVAHEINNPLAVISERAGLVRDMLTLPGREADPGLVDNIDIVLESVERCGQITKQLLGFACKIDLTIEKLDLGRVVRGVLRFLEKEAEYRSIDINVDIPSDLPPIHSDRGKLQQITLNLVTNALQAMKSGGRMAIAANLGKDRDVILRFSDTGCGIAPEHLSRIFDPFFTTKGNHEGSGLGLSITYGLVRKLGGAISVESEINKGTTFFVSLPLRMEEQGVGTEDTVG
ncbi:two-component sensor histidine kinase [Pseudodesulfovibrio sp. F-1]|uniref:histidine kinase n=1 Tax=Pseudodesulfovibrio alkaliphilus TaxID=2661613 RepID=A0A7K1KIY8_9BACT|nr:PAS domain-containing sensor histidine kinase [Pseudodesulfovibrio alkaliphilus]MUM76029.1 two-component sensor histidine kinase [Pseudodesulfovibrio alkaliphilus]